MKLVSNYVCLPSKKIHVKNYLIDKFLKTDDEADTIIGNTGVVSFGVTDATGLTDYAMKAAHNIKDIDGNFWDSVDALIFVSQSYDQRMPSLSVKLQGFLGLDPSIICFDVIDGCAGFIKATILSNMLISSGRKKVVVVAGDLNSILANESEYATRILFGDGLSFSVFENSECQFESRLFNDGDNGGVISCKFNSTSMVMNGFEVFRFTRNVVPRMVRKYLSDNNISVNDYGLIAYHQASNLVVSSLTKLVGLSNVNRPNFNCGHIGNLGAGSIGAWISGNQDLTDGKLRRILCLGYGAGLSWGLADFDVDLKRNEVIYV